MSKYEKLIAKLLNRDAQIKYQEVLYLLARMGYRKSEKRRTSGSRVAFVNDETSHIIRLHKPHPGNELKAYAKKLLINELKDRKLI